MLEQLRAWILGFCYFSLYGFICLEFTYLPTYLLHTLKFSGSEFGMLYSGIPIIGILSQPFWGQMADKSQKTGKMIRLCTFLAVLFFIPLLFDRSFWCFCICLWLVSFFMSAISSLLDTLTLTRFGMQRYASIRLGGSIGYGVFALLFPSEKVAWAVPAIGLALLLCWIVSLFLGEEEGRPKPQVQRVYCFALLGTPAFVVLLLFGFFHWASNIPYHMILDVHQRSLFVLPNATGAAVALGILAECLLMASASRWLGKASPRLWLLLGASITGIRWALMSYPLPKEIFIVLQVLHGFSFVIFFLASVAYMISFVPAEMRASGQALFSGVTFAGSNIVGSLYIAYLLGLPGHTFLVFGFAAFVSAVAVAVTLWIPATPAAVKSR